MITDITTSLLGLFIIYYTTRWVLNAAFFHSPFRNIPGPPSQSWITGKYLTLLRSSKSTEIHIPLGNLGQLFNSKGLPFHLELVERFGGMVKVKGFFGVRGIAWECVS